MEKSEASDYNAPPTMRASRRHVLVGIVLLALGFLVFGFFAKGEASPEFYAHALATSYPHCKDDSVGFIFPGLPAKCAWFWKRSKVSWNLAVTPLPSIDGTLPDISLDEMTRRTFPRTLEAPLPNACVILLLLRPQHHRWYLEVTVKFEESIKIGLLQISKRAVTHRWQSEEFEAGR